MNTPTAIVLAAGKGTRMKSDLPKVLCQANGRPLIDYVIESLRSAGVGKIVVVVGYEAEQVKQSLSKFDDIEFALQEQQLGTGHAVMVCRELLADVEGPVFVVAGDSPMLQSSSLIELTEKFQSAKPACLLGTLVHDNPTGLGRIARDDNGRFVAIVEEKDATETQRAIREVNMSTYLFDCQKLLSALGQLNSENAQSEYYLTDVPAILLKGGHQVDALPVLKPIEALSVNTVEHLALVEAEMKKSQSS